MYEAEDLLPISGLQHLAFCRRQCALIHIERLWQENRLTAEGGLLHERVHSNDNESRGDVLLVRGLRLVSHRLGLTGVADMVEFHRLSETESLPETGSAGCRLAATPGIWSPFPVEYKRGRPKRGNHDAVQLCAQAICLEEMLGITIAEGALFYGQTKRRKNILFDQTLRSETESMADEFHRLIADSVLPPAQYAKHCENCSLMGECMPKSRKSATSYLARQLAEHLHDPEESEL